jgi:dihydrofolate reductase
VGGEFLRQGLIDELVLHVNPVLIGAGQPLFPPDLQLDLDLLGTKQFGNGVVQLRYAVRYP